ncbi:MAG TPA: ABC transporter ATP-binding protein [Terriglobales bacterium]|nr:ABC transporter ATP-binding protein [Terriglobales bacterium]
MIRLSALRKQFGSLIAVNDLNLTIPKGEIYGLIGPNGAGKTTTIRMMAGLLAPTKGEIEIAGVDVRAEPERAQRHIGYLSDFFAVYDDLKVWEYLDYFAHAYKMPEAEIPARIKEVIAEVTLEVKTDSIIAGLSRGMKQRLGIARAIIHKPEVLLLDEPASGLDPKARFELRVLLQKMRDQGTTILISSHILTELEGFCTSIGIMEKGQLLRSGRIEDVTAAESPARTIELRWVSASPDQVSSILSQFAEISLIDLAANEGSFSFAGSDERLSEVLAAMVSAQVRLISFNERKTTVEDLYMKVSHHEVM